jgi:Ca2+-binding EF-hand superfamily protein
MKEQENSFLKNLKKIDPEGFVEKYEYPDDLKDKIHHKRFWTIIKSEGSEAKADEVQTLLDYYTKKTGRDVTFEELFKKNK